MVNLPKANKGSGQGLFLISVKMGDKGGPEELAVTEALTALNRKADQDP